MNDPSSKSSTLRVVPSAFVGTIVTLWTVDVLFFLPAGGLAAPRNLIGLALVHAQLSIWMVVGGLVAAFVLKTWTRGRPGDELSALLLPVLLVIVALTCAATGWGVDLLGWKPVYAILPVVALVAWSLLRKRVARQRGEHPGIWGFVRLLLVPTVCLAATDRVVRVVREGAMRDSDPVPLGIAALMALGALAALSGRRLPRTALHARGLFPVLLASVLPLVACLRFARYGQAEGNHGAAGRAGPDVVVIVLDTVRADHLPMYGYELETMPQLARWAEGALVASRAMSPAGWTSPAHASIFTGAPASLHGVHYGRETFRTRARAGLRWLPELLAEAGYESLAVSANPFAMPEEARGFGRILVPDLSHWDRPGIAGSLENRFPAAFPLSAASRWRIAHPDAREMTGIVQRALPDGEGPQFLFVNYLDAHSPYHPPRGALDAIGARTPAAFNRYTTHRNLTHNWQHLPEGKERFLRELYDGELRWMDEHLGRLLTWIDERLGADTVVVVTSDHGEELGEEGRVGHEYGLPQSVVHVPLLLRAPGVEPGRFEQPITLRHLFPFVAGVAETGVADVELLAREDQFGWVSERYASGANAADLGQGYGRAWVSLFEGLDKGTGPSEGGFVLTRIDESNFAIEVPHTDEGTAQRLREAIDAYWTTYRDQREEEGTSESEEEDLLLLRSLGYTR